MKRWLIGKDPDAGRDWGQEEKGTTGWDGWMASLTQWTWVWVNSGSWWWTGRPGVLRFMGSQRVGQDWATDLISWWFGKLSHFFLSIGQLPTFHPLHFQCHEIGPRVLVIWRFFFFFCCCNLLWDISILFITTLSSYVKSSPLLSTSLCISS